MLTSRIALSANATALDNLVVGVIVIALPAESTEVAISSVLEDVDVTFTAVTSLFNANSFESLVAASFAAREDAVILPVKPATAVTASVLSIFAHVLPVEIIQSPVVVLKLKTLTDLFKIK